LTTDITWTLGPTKLLTQLKLCCKFVRFTSYLVGLKFNQNTPNINEEREAYASLSSDLTTYTSSPRDLLASKSLTKRRTSPDTHHKAMRLGMAIRPFNVSARSQIL